MPFNDPFDNDQTQSRPLFTARAGHRRTLKGTEEFGQFIRRDALAFILNREQNMTVIKRKPDIDTALRVRVLCGIADKVIEDLGDFIRIDLGDRYSFGVEMKFDLLTGSDRTIQIDDTLGEGDEIGRLEVQIQLP
jgi:hypothetical protein